MSGSIPFPHLENSLCQPGNPGLVKHHSARIISDIMLKVLLGAAVCVTLSSCGQFFAPEGWPVEVSPQSHAVTHLKEHVKFTGSGIRLTEHERALLTFLDNDDNIAASVGKKNRPGAHQWSAAEIYRVDPGRHVSVLCENGYQQTAVYFHYDEEQKTWFRVNHLGENHNRGVAAVIVK